MALAAGLWTAAQSGAARAGLRRYVAEALSSRVPGARLLGGARVTPSFRVVFGPVVIPSPRPGARPIVAVTQVTVRPRLTGLLRGRLEAASVRLDGVSIDAGARGEELADLVRSSPRSGGAIAPADRADAPRVTFRDLRLRLALARGPRALAVELAPLSGRAELVRQGDAARAEVALRFPGGGEGELRLAWSGGTASLAARLRGVGPVALPAAVRARLPLDLEGGTLDAAVDVPRVERGAPVSATFTSDVRGLSVRSRRLGPEAVGPLSGRLSGTVRWDPGERSLALDGGRAELGESGRAAVAVEAGLRLGRDPSFRLALRADAVDWAAAVAALPDALRPPREAPRLAGALAGWLSVAGPLHRPSAWRLEGDVDLRRLGAAGPQPVALAGPFTFHAPVPGGGERDVVVGPGNPAFVPLAALPPYVWRAVVMSEDAGFFLHHGFDVREVQDALSRAGERRLRGASTLTQQLAKNLYLAPDRTVSRKVREALATIALESSLGKRRILEIYLNVVEWGPGGVRGLGEAARHWFGKDARALSPKEAAFLATVLPNPVRYDLYRRRGSLTEHWDERVQDLLLKLRAAGVLDEQQFYDAWYGPLAFAHGRG